MSNNQIEITAKIIGNVTLGTGNYIGHNSILLGPLVIGSNNYIGNFVTIGTPPQDDVIRADQHYGYGADKEIRIGDNNTIREFVTIHKGLTSTTEIGNKNYLMSYSHIAHDCRIQNFTKIANSVQMGGYTTIQDHTYLGLSSVLHQFTVIGQACMVGMNSTVTSSHRPGSMIVGSPARSSKPNHIGLGKIGISDTSWWNENANNYPSSYSRIFDLYEEELLRRQTEADLVRKLRAEIFLRWQ